MALFDDIQEVKKFITANISTNINDLLPYIDRAIEGLIFGVMPVDFFDELIEKKAINILTPLEEKLLAKIQMPAANYAQYLSIPAGNVQTSSTGIHVVVTDNKKTAAQWQINQLRAAAIFAAGQGLESLGAFLYENSANFPDWANSELEQKRRRRIIGSAADLSKYVYTGGSFITFWKLGAILERIENLHLSNLFPSFEAWEAFLDAKQAGTLDFAQKKQLAALQGAAACYAVSYGIDELCINYTQNGIAPILAADMGTNTGGELPLDRIRHFVANKKTSAGQYLEIAAKLIQTPPPIPIIKDSGEKVFYL